MAKYSRNRRVALRGKKQGQKRRWFSNVGDGAKITRDGRTNPNDSSRVEFINRHYAKPGCHSVEV
jgi:hypothetical protein